MNLKITVAANGNPNDFRAILYEATAPNIAVAAQDILLPHTSSQQIVFTGLNQVAHYYRLYELIGVTLGSQLSECFVEPTTEGVSSELPIELHVGLAGGDRLTPATNVYNGSAEFPQYIGKIAKIDYWVEQRGVGKLLDNEYSDNSAVGTVFSFKLNGSALFNDDDTYFIVFKPVVTVNPANFPAARVELYDDIVLVNTSRLIDATYANKIIDVQSPGGNLTLTLDALANMPNIKFFHFVNNFGAQKQTTIKAATGEKIYFNGSEVDQISFSMSGYLTINKKGTRWYFIDGNIIEYKRFVGDPGEPALQNSWLDPGITIFFRKDFSENKVHINGIVTKNSYNGSNQIIFTMPSVDYYPKMNFIKRTTLIRSTSPILVDLFVDVIGNVRITNFDLLTWPAEFGQVDLTMSYFTD